MERLCFSQLLFTNILKSDNTQCFQGNRLAQTKALHQPFKQSTSEDVMYMVQLFTSNNKSKNKDLSLTSIYDILYLLTQCSKGLMMSKSILCQYTTVYCIIMVVYFYIFYICIWNMSYDTGRNWMISGLSRCWVNARGAQGLGFFPWLVMPLNLALSDEVFKGNLHIKEEEMAHRPLVACKIKQP